MKLSEVRILNTIRLSETQKIILARVVNAPNPHVAYENINEGPNLVASSKELIKIELLSVSNGQAEVTEQGNSVLQNENIIDESGGLTETGQQYAEMKGPSESDDAQPPAPTETGGEDMSEPEMDPAMQETIKLDLLRSFADEIHLKENLERLSTVR